MPDDTQRKPVQTYFPGRDDFRVYRNGHNQIIIRQRVPYGDREPCSDVMLNPADVPGLCRALMAVMRDIRQSPEEVSDQSIADEDKGSVR